MKIELRMPNMRSAEIKGTVYRESGVFGLRHTRGYSYGCHILLRNYDFSLVVSACMYIP